MKGKLLALFFTCMSVLVKGQDAGDMGYTLEQCIDYALENSVDAKNAELDKEIARARVKETVGIGLPQVNGAVSVTQSPTQQRFFTQYSDDPERFSFIDQNTAQSIGIRNGDVVAAENFFQLKGAGDASLSVNQLVFNGSYIVGLQAANTYKELAVKSSNQTQEEVVMNVSKAFYNYLINQELLESLRSNIARIDTLYRTTKAMYENGFAEKIDADRIKVNRNNLLVARENLENMTEVALSLLKFQMNYPSDQPLPVKGSLEEAAIEPIEIPDENSWDYSFRPDYQVLQVNKSLQELNIKNKYAEGIPVISAFANLGYSTQSPDFAGIFVTNSDFDEVGGIGPDKWYGYSMLGLRLNWSIFTGLQRSYQIQQEKLTLAKLENGFEAKEKAIDIEIDRSKKNLETSLGKLEVQRENMELASEIFRITNIKYQEGVGSNLEVIEADDSLKEAQTNYYSALYDALLAQLELKKALGILYN